jgi:formate dehydrogenase subunit gamma
MTTPRPGRIRRFGLSTRWVHRTTSILFVICLVTSFILYIPQLSLLVGRRALVMNIHIYCGLALPVPVLLGWLAGGFRRDTTELNRFHPQDRAWMRAHLSLLREIREARIGALARTGPPLVGGKFNAGQKLYAAAIAGSIIVFLGTGLIMWLGQDLGIPDRYRTGATFVHTLSAFAAFFAVAGHLWMAARDPVARTGMRTGFVPVWWAEIEHPHWAAPPPEPGADSDGSAGAAPSTWASPEQADSAP